MDYSNYAKNYAVYRTPYTWVIEPIVSEIKHFPKGSRILEIGCGTGNYAIAVSQKLDNYFFNGFDLSEEMLNIARSRTREIEFTSGNADVAFPYQDKFADLAFLVDVIQHITNYSVFFTKCFRILKPNGSLIIVTDSEENMRKRSLTKYFPEILEIEQGRYPKINELTRFATKNGFKIGYTKLAEGFIEIDDEFIARVKNKFSSAMRLMKDVDHKRGVERVLEAKIKGKKWFSSYTILKYNKFD